MVVKKDKEGEEVRKEQEQEMKQEEDGGRKWERRLRKVDARRRRGMGDKP